MSNIIEQIKERRTANTSQSLMMLDMVPLSDTDTKYSLLSSASPYLQDPAIAAKWIDLIEAEKDTQLKADMLLQLAGTGMHQIAIKDRFIHVLINSLQQDESRDIILPLLGRFSITYKQARQHLISFYRQQDNRDVSSMILSWLLIPLDASPEDLSFYKEILNKVDEADKLVLVNRLLLQHEADLPLISQLLTPEEPFLIKEMVLRFCFDRSYVPTDALAQLIKSDRSPLICIRCIQLLAVHGIDSPELIDVLLESGRNDPDASVRNAALHAFSYSIKLTPAIITHLCNNLATEKEAGIALGLINLLAPYTAQHETLSNALSQLLTQNIQTTLAVRIYEILGKLIPQRPALFERFVQLFEQEQHTECRTAILNAIAAAVTTGDELNSFYLKALDATSPAIKEAGIRGILLIPLTRTNIATVEAAAPVLLYPDLQADLRRTLARKISTIPDLSSATIQVFGKLADHETDATIRDICTKVQESAISQAGGEHINWEQWLHKADVEHDFSGIFPHLWMYYDDNPAMARSILWAALTPGGSSSLYQERVSDVDILRFLAVKAGIDDNLSRYTLNQLLTTDLGNESKFRQYLLVLKSNPQFAELKEGLWSLLEKRGRYINLLQLDELNHLIWGDELETVFRQHLQKQQSAAGVLPYISYLSANSSWAPVPELLQWIVQQPFVQQDADAMRALKDATRNAGMDLEKMLRNAAPEKPGFADEEGPGFAD
ncbi:hypothetical protein [Chitinophaga pinensis]|uniref:HEAT repeat domain-containing protein n=1 Tax=Chitinophaga pinensis (strain ATCC 43595 / DSM 2588 / LMG 13176 / NBRC 15968 / NCIMB 11800 / UQM 2034) TaxID=485918 RepID=A0A979G2H6_CHIPD|nr:hypothetical protein [Chitinophaga pinensis]ACU59609.1 hypothetical protein Cpin_2116 [Chitinophaga pinensis DSM 2588]